MAAKPKQHRLPPNRAVKPKKTFGKKKSKFTREQVANIHQYLGGNGSTPSFHIPD